MGKEQQLKTREGQWAAIATPEEAEAAARELWLDYYRAEPVTPLKRSPMEKLSPASEQTRKNIHDFLDTIPTPLLLHLTVPRADELPPMARIRNEAEKLVQKERSQSRMPSISKGKKLHIRREKAHRRRGAKPGDIH